MQAYKKRGFWIGLAAFFFVLLTPNPESLSPIGWAVAAVTLTDGNMVGYRGSSSCCYGTSTFGIVSNAACY
jgi:hypothetical protein